VIRPRRDGWQVIVYTGIDPATGRQRQISRQVTGSRKQAERVETRLKAEVLAGRHRGTAAKTLGEMVDVYLEWREQNGKPIGPRTLQGYHAWPRPGSSLGSGSSGFPRSILRRWLASTPRCARAGASASPATRCQGAASRCARGDFGRAGAGGKVRLGALQRCGVGAAAGAPGCSAGDADQAAGPRGAPGGRA
jgi:hypothetical protein